MRKLALLLLLYAFLPFAQAMAEVDPEEILRQLPPPQVNYAIPEIKSVKPPVALPDYSNAEHFGRPQPSQEQLERSLENIKAVLEVPALTSTMRLLSNLADEQTKSSQRVSHSHSAAGDKDDENEDNRVTVTSSARPIKPPPPLVVPKPAKPTYPPPTGKLISAWKTLRKNPGLLEFEASLNNDRQLAADAFDIMLQLSEKAENMQPKSDGPAEENGEPTAEEGAGEETAPAGSHDAVLAKAMGLYKKQDWKGIKNLFQENLEAGESKEGLRYLVEAEINEAKPNYMQIRRLAGELLKLAEDDPIGNYGMALYFYNAKKPNTAKAQTHLDIALKAKNPPEGASGLYWQMTFKKFMIPLLVLLAAIIGGISQVIKKRKAAAGEAASEPDSNEENAEKESKPAGKLMQKLGPIIDKLKGLMARFKKKPAAATEGDIDSEESETETTETSEEADESEPEETENEKAESEDEESEEETEEEEDNELEADDAENTEEEEEEEEEEDDEDAEETTA